MLYGFFWVKIGYFKETEGLTLRFGGRKVRTTKSRKPVKGSAWADGNATVTNILGANREEVKRASFPGKSQDEAFYLAFGSLR